MSKTAKHFTAVLVILFSVLFQVFDGWAVLFQSCFISLTNSAFHTSISYRSSLCIAIGRCRYYLLVSSCL